MKILITGAKGFVGKNLTEALNNIKDGKDRTHPEIAIDGLYLYDIDTDSALLDEYCKDADFVFNLAGVNRPQNPEEFVDGNFGFVAGVNSLLVYAENGKAELLPALPSDWENGEIENIVTGGVQLSFKWENGKVVSVSADKPITLMNANLAENCKIGANVTVE